MNKYLSSCYHLLWYSVAVLLILAAVMVTAVRLALPGIGSYKDQIQAWVSGYMQYPVVINEISADWTGWSPNLHLRNIDLYDQENNRRIARFDYASLGIDLVSSLWRGEIIPQHLSITGLNLDLIRNNDGSISLRNQTMPSNTGNSGNPELAQWLLSQRYIILDEATVDWTDN
ncbi:MAG: AsmA family protein, partial [Gammaproteobacteria bacterium]